MKQLIKKRKIIEYKIWIMNKKLKQKLYNIYNSQNYMIRKEKRFKDTYDSNFNNFEIKESYFYDNSYYFINKKSF